MRVVQEVPIYGKSAAKHKQEAKDSSNKISQSESKSNLSPPAASAVSPTRRIVGSRFVELTQLGSSRLFGDYSLLNRLPLRTASVLCDSYTCDCYQLSALDAQRALPPALWEQAKAHCNHLIQHHDKAILEAQQLKQDQDSSVHKHKHPSATGEPSGMGPLQQQIIARPLFSTSPRAVSPRKKVIDPVADLHAQVEASLEWQQYKDRLTAFSIAGRSEDQNRPGGASSGGPMPAHSSIALVPDCQLQLSFSAVQAIDKLESSRKALRAAQKRFAKSPPPPRLTSPRTRAHDSPACAPKSEQRVVEGT